MVQVAPHKSSIVSNQHTWDLTEEQRLCYHIAGSVSEGKYHLQISNIYSSVYVLCGSPQSNTNCLNLVLLQALMNACCKTVLLKKKMFLMLVEVPPRLWVFPKEKLSLQQLLWKKSWHMLRFLYCILFHSIIQSLQFPTYLFAIYILQPAQWKYSPFLSCLSLKGCQ